MEMNLFIDRVLEAARAAGIETAEVYCQSGESFRASAMDGEINQYQVSASAGLSLRGTVDGKMGYSATHTIIAHGVQTASPHDCGSGPIRAGECIVADIFPRNDVTGYWGDMTRTFVKGKAPDIVRKAYKAVKDASSEAFAMLRPGISGALVHNRALEILKRAGFETGKDKDGLPCGFIHSLGHGVGLEIHEGPRLSPYNALPLRPGNVVSVEPGVYYHAWGGVRLEDLALITLDGVENLNKMEMTLEIP